MIACPADSAIPTTASSSSMVAWVTSGLLGCGAYIINANGYRLSSSLRLAGLRHRPAGHGRYLAGPAFRQFLLAGTDPGALRQPERPGARRSRGGAGAAFRGGARHAGVVLPGPLEPGARPGRGGAETRGRGPYRFFARRPGIPAGGARAGQARRAGDERASWFPLTQAGAHRPRSFPRRAAFQPRHRPA